MLLLSIIYERPTKRTNQTKTECESWIQYKEEEHTKQKEDVEQQSDVCGRWTIEETTSIREIEILRRGVLEEGFSTHEERSQKHEIL